MQQDDISEKQCLELVRLGLSALFNNSDMGYSEVVEVFTYPSSAFEFDRVQNNFRKALMYFASSLKARSKGHIQNKDSQNFTYEMLNLIRDSAKIAGLDKHEIWQDPVFSLDFTVCKQEDVESGDEFVSYEYKECDDDTL